MRRVVNRAMGKKPHLKSLFIPLNSSLLLNAFVQTETHSGLDLALKASDMIVTSVDPIMIRQVVIPSSLQPLSSQD